MHFIVGGITSVCLFLYTFNEYSKLNTGTVFGI